ncbi:MAG: hypothetical protein WC980_04840 [Candidatus Brocadiia bacterium]
MKKPFLIILSVLISSLILLGIVGLMKAGLVSAADDPNKTFALKPAPVKGGDKEKIIYKFEATATAKFPSMGSHPATPMYSRMERETEQKLVEIDSDTMEIVKIERNYKSSKVLLSKTSTEGKTDIFNGKVLMIDNMNDIALKDASASKDPKKADGGITDEIKQTMSIDENNFRLILPPSSEVKIGDKWDVDGRAAERIFNFANPRVRPLHHGCREIGINCKLTQGKMSCTLKEVKKPKGVSDECAIIDISVNFKGNDSGLELSAAMSGTATFNLKKGKFIKVECKGPLTMKGQQPCTGTYGSIGPVECVGEVKVAVEFK